MVENAEKVVTQEEKLVITLAHKLSFLFLASLATISYIEFWNNGYKEVVAGMVGLISLCVLDLLWDSKYRNRVLIVAGVLNIGILVALLTGI